MLPEEKNGIAEPQTKKKQRMKERKEKKNTGAW